MATIAVKQLQSALTCLEQYRDYGEHMRKIGRGFHPTGVFGEDINWVIDSVRDAIAKANGA